MSQYLTGLMRYVDRLEDLMFEVQPRDGTIDNDRFVTVMGLKKYVMDTLVYELIDKEVAILRATPEPIRDLVKTMIGTWILFAENYPRYLDKTQIKDYIVKQCIQEE